MSFEVLTVPRFEKEAKAIGKRQRSLRSDLAVLIDSLEENPFQGDELTPGIRKIRMAITSKGRGKSGGARVMEKAREFDPFGHAGFDPTGIIRLTP